MLPNHEGDLAIPPCLMNLANRLGVPGVLLTELVRELGLRQLAVLLYDQEALKAALVEAQQKLRERLLREEGIPE